MLPAANRLRRAGAIDRLFRRGANLSSEHLILKFMRTAPPTIGGGPTPMVAVSQASVVAGKKLAPRAVDRNRLRRRAREALRLQMQLLPPGLDLLVVVRSLKLLTLDFQALLAELAALLIRLPR